MLSQTPAYPSPDDKLTFCDVKDPTMCVRPMAKLEPAPFSGELMTLPLALKLKQADRDCQDRADAQVQSVKADAQIEMDRIERLRDAESQAHRQVMLQCVDAVQKQQKALKDAEPPFYARPWFVAPLTFILTAGVMGYAFTR